MSEIIPCIVTNETQLLLTNNFESVNCPFSLFSKCVAKTCTTVEFFNSLLTPSRRHLALRLVTIAIISIVCIKGVGKGFQFLVITIPVQTFVNTHFEFCTLEVFFLL